MTSTIDVLTYLGSYLKTFYYLRIALQIITPDHLVSKSSVQLYQCSKLLHYSSDLEQDCK